MTAPPSQNGDGADMERTGKTDVTCHVSRKKAYIACQLSKKSRYILPSLKKEPCDWQPQEIVWRYSLSDTIT